MRIRFLLMWTKPGTVVSRAFRLQGACALFEEFVGRISKFAPCEAFGAKPDRILRTASTQLWVCDREAGSKVLSSEALAERLEALCHSGVKELQILIGGPDGLSERELAQMKPDFKWSFGPMTLPHELAAVVASEQVYRAWTILKRLPYHLAHTDRGMKSK